MDKKTPTVDQRIRAAFYGLAVCDALGGPLEFRPRRRGPSDYIRNMEPNSSFNLPAGHWTDDTSMALCLAGSLATTKGKHDAVDQARRYVMWLDEGYMSSVPGRAFDVGIQTTGALGYWRSSPSLDTQAVVAKKFNEERRCGNGSLMRCLPCGLIAVDEEDAYTLGRQSSLVTHPHVRCLDACSIYSVLVFNALRGTNKEQLLEILIRSLAKKGIDVDLRERLKTYTSVQSFADKPRKQISSSGYVLNSFEAALWAFFSTDTFEEGAIEVVNLGDDADTVGAIYGGLAATYYGSMDLIPEKWLNEMKETQLVDDAIDSVLNLRKEGEGIAQES